MKAYLLIDENQEGYFPVGIYSKPQKALAAMRKMEDSRNTIVREYEIDDPVTHNYVRVYDPT